jgi:hypothetical protein
LPIPGECAGYILFIDAALKKPDSRFALDGARRGARRRWHLRFQRPALALAKALGKPGGEH